MPHATPATRPAPEPGKTTGPILVAGGGIGGLAAALTLAKSGYRVEVLEQAREFSEIGAGLQLGPNATRMLRKWGVMEALEPHLVAPDDLRMMDGISGRLLTRIPLGETFTQRFGAPYYVAHRADLHRALLAACQRESAIALHTHRGVSDVRQDDGTVSVSAAGGHHHEGAALIGADGLWSQVRRHIIGDGDPSFANLTAYRALLQRDEMPSDCAWNAAALWATPGAHLVHYPISGGRAFNVVATVTSDFRHEGWNEPGDRDELLWHFRCACPQARAVLEAGTSWRKWALADRVPVTGWSKGRITLLGDAAHAVLQHYAQGAAMALEDADCLAQSLTHSAGDIAGALKIYEKARQPRTARLFRESRKLGAVYNAGGLKRWIRNLVLPRTSPERWYEKVAWVYGGGP